MSSTYETANQCSYTQPVQYPWLVKCVFIFCLTLIPVLPLQAAPQIPTSVHTVTDAVHALGYQSNWLRATRQQALLASQDREYYLANRLFRILARQGDRDAAFRLGLFYDQAPGADHNSVLAVYWYRTAAAAGELHAMHNLAVAYANGKGVDMDMSRAIKWWTEAAVRGNPDSQYNLGILYALGEFGVQKNIEQAKHWWLKAAQHGDAMAQYNLGTLYANSTVRDYCEAAHWWTMAASNGVEQAGLALRMIKYRQVGPDCR